MKNQKEIRTKSLETRDLASFYNKMAKRGDYVYDELLCFLGNPFFQVPVLTFMEAKCLSKIFSVNLFNAYILLFEFKHSRDMSLQASARRSKSIFSFTL